MRIWLLRTASSVIKDLCSDVILVITVADCRRQELRDSVWDLEGVGGVYRPAPPESVNTLGPNTLTHVDNVQETDVRVQKGQRCTMK